MFTLLHIFRESPYYPKFKGGVLALVLVHLLAALGFLAVSGGRADPMDALYMAFNVISTVGFREVVEVSAIPWGRPFTMVVGFGGIAVTWYLFSVITAFVLETNLNQAYRRQRMERKIAGMSGHYIVCGVGRVGSYVADELIKTERAFVVVDSDPQRLPAHQERTGHDTMLLGDASDDDLLVKAGVMRAAGVFAVTGDDSKNLVVSLSARQLNPAVRVVARVHDRHNVEKTRRAGADEIVSPDFTGGLRIASAMLRPNAVNLMDMMLHTDENLRVEEVEVPRGTPVGRAGQLMGRREWLLVALRDAGLRWDFNPGADRAVSVGDTVVAIVSPGGRRVLEQVLGVKAQGAGHRAQ